MLREDSLENPKYRELKGQRHLDLHDFKKRDDSLENPKYRELKETKVEGLNTERAAMIHWKIPSIGN